MKRLFLVCLFTLPLFGRVAFLETRAADGTLQQFEEDFPYTHVALEIGSQWLHAYPGRGVELTDFSALNRIGTVVEMVEVPEGLVKRGEEKPYLGKPYDFSYSWSDAAFYCSELIGKILGIAPSPMHFAPELWPPAVYQWEGDWGVSPSLIYRWISAANHDVSHN